MSTDETFRLLEREFLLEPTKAKLDRLEQLRFRTGGVSYRREICQLVAEQIVGLYRTEQKKRKAIAFALEFDDVGKQGFQGIENLSLPFGKLIRFVLDERLPGYFGAARWVHRDDWHVVKDAEHFEMETRGPWGIVSRLRALARDGDGFIYGMRTMSNPRESGYSSEGTISIGGVRTRAFTSSMMCFDPTDNWKLVDKAILYACI